MSGARDSLPQLNRLIANAHQRRFDVIVVWKFDRTARSVSLYAREPISDGSRAFQNSGKGFSNTADRSLLRRWCDFCVADCLCRLLLCSL
jgi:hypothetical protein